MSYTRSTVFKRLPQDIVVKIQSSKRIRIMASLSMRASVGSSGTIPDRTGQPNMISVGVKLIPRTSRFSPGSPDNVRVNPWSSCLLACTLSGCLKLSRTVRVRPG